MELVGEGGRGGQRAALSTASPPVRRSRIVHKSTAYIVGRSVSSGHAQPVAPWSHELVLKPWACMLWRLLPSPNSYPNELRMLQGWAMTNACDESARLDFVGVDMAKQAFVWGVHAQRGTQAATNDLTGFEALLAQLKERRIGLIVIEATGGLERALATFLLAHGLPVAVVNPRAAREFARSMGHLAKTDAIDALALAHYAQTLAAKADQAGVGLVVPSEQVQALQTLVQRRAQLMGMRTSEKNRRGGAIRVLRQSIDAVVKTLDSEIAKLDTEINKHLDTHFRDQAKRFEAIKGIGMTTCATLIAFMPELGQVCAARAAKLAGLAPLNQDSGQARGKRRSGAAARSCGAPSTWPPSAPCASIR